MLWSVPWRTPEVLMGQICNAPGNLEIELVHDAYQVPPTSPRYIYRPATKGLEDTLVI